MKQMANELAANKEVTSYLAIKFIELRKRMNRADKKIFVVDTSVLINDPDIFCKVGNNEIVVPTAVIKELDGLKRNPDPEDPTAKAARKVSRILDMLGSHQDISQGAKTPYGSIVRICSRYAFIDDLASNADNRIVGTAIKLRQEILGNVILVSRDGNMRNITRAYGIDAENYPFCSGVVFNSPKKKSCFQARNPFIMNSRYRGRKRAYKLPAGNKSGAVILFILIILFIVMLNVK